MSEWQVDMLRFTLKKRQKMELMERMLHTLGDIVRYLRTRAGTTRLQGEAR